VLAHALQLAAAHSSVVVDLSECSFIDSTAIPSSLVLRARKGSGERFMLVIPSRGKLRSHASPDMVRLAEIVEVYQTKDASTR